ncbi:MAG: sulfurtransferase complex subunit TusD [Shewanellaceae bacterium]|nr:sulfurtransferase complex subunit TusD [Shewanellaceae bacterium]
MSTSFVIVVYHAPYGHESAYHALRFAETVIAMGQCIEQVFFYQDGTLHANALNLPPSDEINLQQRWQSLQQQAGFPLHCCISAAIKRGVISSEDQQDCALPSHNLAAGFTNVGLPALMEAMTQAEQVVEF